MAVAVRRWCYSRPAVFYPGQTFPTRIVYFWAPPGAAVLPIPSVFYPLATYEGVENTDGIGELTSAPLTRTNGAAPVSGLVGDHYEGTPADFLGMGTIPPRFNDGIPPDRISCFVSPALGLVGGDTSALIPISSATVGLVGGDVVWGLTIGGALAGLVGGDAGYFHGSAVVGLVGGDVGTDPYPYTGDGGWAMGGVATAALGAIGTGGWKLGGVADTFTPFFFLNWYLGPSGTSPSDPLIFILGTTGWAMGGVADASLVDTTYVGTGGWAMGGVAYAVEAYTGTGGWAMGGVADASVVDTTFTGTGGWAMGGVASAELVPPYYGTGGWAMGGVASAELVPPYYGTGGWAMGGVASASVRPQTLEGVDLLLSLDQV